MVEHGPTWRIKGRAMARLGPMGATPLDGLGLSGRYLTAIFYKRFTLSLKVVVVFVALNIEGKVDAFIR